MGRKFVIAEVTSYCRKEVRKLMQRLVRTSHFRLNCRVDDLAKPAPAGAGPLVLRHLRPLLSSEGRLRPRLLSQ